METMAFIVSVNKKKVSLKLSLPDLGMDYL